MSKPRVQRKLQRFAAALAASLTCGIALAQDASDERPSTVQDLAYGEVLFHLFQEDYFTALTKLLVGQARDEFSYHEDEAELLLGGLHLSYGQHRRAGDIFGQLLQQSVAPSLHDRAWFFLAKIWYQRGYLDEAELALTRIGDSLPDPIESDRQLLLARVLMAQGRFDAALAVLSEWQNDDDWVGYAKYNVGVSLVRLGRIDEGTRVLDEVGRMVAGDADLSGLRDKANVALGYAWLQAAQPDLARPSLARVRLRGPFSNKALLGVGWADAERGDYRAALTPWIELSDRNILDPAVQESLLAVPYAFTQLGAHNQAVERYLTAIDAFNAEIGRIDAAIAAVEQGVFISDLLSNRVTDSSGWYWRLDDLPNSIESHYLYELVAAHEFQEGLKNYRDLLYLRENLDGWSESLGAFDDILATRQRAFQQRLPDIERSLDSVDIDALVERRVAAESRLAEIERQQSVAALGTQREQDAWTRLEDVSARLEQLGGFAGADAMRQKQRFLRGVLFWNLSRDYKARHWRAARDLRAIEQELRSVERAYRQVDAVRSDWPDEFTALTSRIAGLTPRVDGLADQLDGLVVRQARFLEGVATRELYAQRDRLSTYLVQARFALASIYDRSATMSSVAPAPDSVATEPLP